MRIIAVLVFICAALHGQAPFPAPGKLVDLGGHRLHVWCVGAGTPAVVVENGLGDFSFDWLLVQRRVAAFTRICTYDRAGYAWSDPGPLPRTYAQLNLELHDALAKLGEPGPWILVGHSFGGGVVRNYAATYPAEVAGMVLVDIVHEDQRIPMGPQFARVRDFATGRSIPEPRENLLESDQTPGAPPAKSAATIAAPYDNLPVREQQLHRWAESLPALDIAETSQKDWSAESLALMHANQQDGILGNLPLVVLTRAKDGYSNAGIEQERQRLQTQLAKLSKNGRQGIVPSGHNMHLENPDAVASAIRAIFDQVKTAAP